MNKTDPVLPSRSFSLVVRNTQMDNYNTRLPREGEAEEGNLPGASEVGVGVCCKDFLGYCLCQNSEEE